MNGPRLRGHVRGVAIATILKHFEALKRVRRHLPDTATLHIQRDETDNSKAGWARYGWQQDGSCGWGSLRRSWRELASWPTPVTRWLWNSCRRRTWPGSPRCPPFLSSIVRRNSAHPPGPWAWVPGLMPGGGEQKPRASFAARTEYPRRPRQVRRRGYLGGWLVKSMGTETGPTSMKRNVAASVLSALLYAQGLLGFAGLATVLLKDRANAQTVSIVETATPAVAASAR